MQRLPLHSGINSKFIYMLLLPFCSLLTILVRQWGLGANNDPVLVLNAKGEKLRPKQMDQLQLDNFENSRVTTFDLSKYSYCRNLASYGENLWLWEKGEFLDLWSISLLEYLSLCLNKCVWLRDRKLNLICKNKPSGGKEWSKYAKLESKQFGLQFELCCMFCVAFWCVGINHQKGGDWKGNVPLGHFHNVLVIKCPTHSEWDIVCQTSEKCKSCNEVRF